MQRDFTYIDDIAEGVDRTSEQVATPDPTWNSSNPNPSSSSAPYRVYNIGNNDPIELTVFIEIIENAIGIKAKKNLLPMQAGDVPATFADIEALETAVGFRPATPIHLGVKRFVDWYRDYFSG
jgi:UDP-glucuronate 4-epimerase